MNAKQQVNLAANKREENINLEQLKNEGWIPVILYGKGFKNVNLQIKYKDFEKAFELAGESSLINLKAEGMEETKVLIKEVQTDPVKDSIIHIDLYKINMKDHINTEIPLIVEGEAPAVKDLGGIMVQHLDKVEVKCLPGDLVHDIKVDVSGLKEFNDNILVKDVNIPEGMEFITKTDIQVVSVSEPRKIEEAIPEETEEEGVEGVEKVGEEGEKNEEKKEEGGEGEKPAAEEKKE